MKRHLQKMKPIYIVCFFMLLLGGLIVADYGLPMDEGADIRNGVVTLNYLLDTFHIKAFAAQREAIEPLLDGWGDGDHGVVFDAPSVALAVAFGFRDFPSIVTFRHSLVFLIFLLGGYSVYQLAFLRFQRQWIALLGVAFYFISPRQFAEGFYNNKDIVFMSAFVAATLVHIHFIRSPSALLVLAASLSAALVIDIRITGVLLPAGFLCVLLLKAIYEKKLTEVLKLTGIYLIALSVFVILFWPYLWSNPVLRFIESFQSLSKYQWGGTVFFNGQSLSAAGLPWYYVPVWIVNTVPIYYLLLCILGAAIVFWRTALLNHRLFQKQNEMLDFVFLSFAVGPVLVVILMRSVLYDGWRHLYFVYPFMLLLCLVGVDAIDRLIVDLIQNRWPLKRIKLPLLNYALQLMFFLPLISLIITMVQMHPYQNVYFNVLAGKDRYKQFDIDYWGLTVKGGLYQILTNDERELISIAANSWVALRLNLWNLKNEDKVRFQVVDQIEDADYVFNNFRSIGAPSVSLHPPLGFIEWYRVSAQDEPVLLIFKRQSGL